MSSGTFDPVEVIRFVRLKLKKLGFLLNEQKTRMQLLGKVNYVLRVHPDDKGFPDARKWLQQSTK